MSCKLCTYYMSFFVLRITFNVRHRGYGECPELHDICPSYLVSHRVFSAGHHNLMLSKRGQVSEWRTRVLSFNCSRLNGMPAASFFGHSSHCAISGLKWLSYSAWNQNSAVETCNRILCMISLVRFGHGEVLVNNVAQNKTYPPQKCNMTHWVKRHQLTNTTTFPIKFLNIFDWKLYLHLEVSMVSLDLIDCVKASGRTHRRWPLKKPNPSDKRKTLS